MNDNVLEQIKETYHSMTKSGKKLADYIFSNTGEAQYLSISALAENSHVSEATVTRFCQGLGFSGYNDFKYALAKATRHTSPDLVAAYPDPISDDDSNESIYKKIQSANLQSLNETFDLLDEDSMRAAASILMKSEKVFCFGSGGSNIMAMEAWARFSCVSTSFIHIMDSHMQYLAASLSSEKDAILFFSYSGATKDMVDVFEIAKKNGVKIILVTHFPKSKGTEYADVVLLCGYNEGPLQSGSIPAKIGQMYLIDCLYHTYCKESPEITIGAQDMTSLAIAKKLL